MEKRRRNEILNGVGLSAFCLLAELAGGHIMSNLRDAGVIPLLLTRQDHNPADILSFSLAAGLVFGPPGGIGYAVYTDYRKNRSDKQNNRRSTPKNGRF